MEPLRFMCVYCDVTGLFSEEECNRCNLCYMEFPENIIRSYFNEFIFDDFRVDEELSNDEVYKDWLNKYTADDTDASSSRPDLYHYAIEKGYRAAK